MDKRGLWATLERPDKNGTESMAKYLMVKNEVIVAPKTKPRFYPQLPRLASLASNNVGKAVGQCHQCRGWFILSYLRRGWSDDMAWPKDAEPFCLDCDKKLRIRRA